MPAPSLFLASIAGTAALLGAVIVWTRRRQERTAAWRDNRHDRKVGRTR